MLIAFSVAPSGAPANGAVNPDGSVHDAVAAAGVARAALAEAVQAATDAVLPFGSRVSLVLKADIRPGHTGEIDGKIERLEAAVESIQRSEPGASDGR